MGPLSPLPVKTTVEPALSTGAVGVSEPNSFREPPFWIVNVPPLVKLWLLRLKEPAETVVVAEAPLVAKVVVRFAEVPAVSPVRLIRKSDENVPPVWLMLWLPVPFNSRVKFAPPKAPEEPSEKLPLSNIV